MPRSVKIKTKHRVYARDHGHCHYCARICIPFGVYDNNKKDAQASVDHINLRSVKRNDHMHNLVLACHECNNKRGCIPYHIFLNERLWLHEYKCKQISRLFSLGTQAVQMEKKNVWLLEMYTESDLGVDHQTWGCFSSTEKVREYVERFFPEAIPNADDDVGYIGYHFPEGSVLEMVSFVANAWDLQ